jgi:hypothetical protein
MKEKGWIECKIEMAGNEKVKEENITPILAAKKQCPYTRSCLISSTTFLC